MNITITKVLISVFKNHKLFSKNIATYRDIPLQNLPLLDRFSASEISVTWLEAPKLGMHTLFITTHVVSKLQLFTFSCFFVKSEIKNFGSKIAVFLSVLGFPNHYHVIFDPQNWHAWCFVNLQCCVKISAFHILPFLIYHKIKKILKLIYQNGRVKT